MTLCTFRFVRYGTTDDDGNRTIKRTVVEPIGVMLDCGHVLPVAPHRPLSLFNRAEAKCGTCNFLEDRSKRRDAEPSPEQEPFPVPKNNAVRVWTKQDDKDLRQFRLDRDEAYERLNRSGEALPLELPETPLRQLYRLTPRAMNVLLFYIDYSANGLTLASTLADARVKLSQAGDARTIFKRLLALKNTGQKTAKLICSVLGFDYAGSHRLCATCTCGRL